MWLSGSQCLKLSAASGAKFSTTAASHPSWKGGDAAGAGRRWLGIGLTACWLGTSVHMCIIPRPYRIRPSMDDRTERVSLHRRCSDGLGAVCLGCAGGISPESRRPRALRGADDIHVSPTKISPFNVQLQSLSESTPSNTPSDQGNACTSMRADMLWLLWRVCRYGLVLGVLPLLPLGGLVWLWGCLRPLYHTAIHQAIDDADRYSLLLAACRLLLKKIACRVSTACSF